ncbi:terminase small subunit [Shewanella sp. A32]|uniref:terminase small subunit n=1 Tax=Shewanella sp. A32 TaxID=3031327 RepID=UPI0023B97764|nr:terminase small subunit [Shewanella sp. A32]MDF0533653.1 terminase small subunit [Shewanella sp. A32]
MPRIKPQDHEPVLLNKTDMCRSLGISTQAFDKWDVPITKREGRQAFYSVSDVVANRVANERKKTAAPEDDPEKPNLDFERWRLTKAQADGQELKNEKDRKEVVEVAFSTFVLQRVSAQISAILEQIPLRIKRKYPDMPPARIDAIKAEIIKASNLAAEVGSDMETMLDDYLGSTDT